MPLPAPKPVPRDVKSPDQVKASMIIRFGDFAVWPPGSMNGKEKPFVIGVMGDDPLYLHLVEGTRKYFIQEKKVKVIKVNDFSQIKNCHLLFIPKFSRRMFKKVMAYVDGLPILTVGDTNNYENRGVMINFYSFSDRIRYNVNYLVAKENGITITSKILQQARNIIRK